MAQPLYPTSLPKPPSPPGFWELVPRQLLAVFSDHELELLISGLPDIDVADLRANTEYSGYTVSGTACH